MEKNLQNRLMGHHLIIDIWGGKQLDDPVYIEEAIKNMAKVAGATLINTFLHHFGQNSGVTGIAILAESHISIHTWPEYEFAAIDIFMCGKADVNKTIPLIQKLFSPTRIEFIDILRGQLTDFNKKLNLAYPAINSENLVKIHKY